MIETYVFQHRPFQNTLINHKWEYDKYLEPKELTFYILLPVWFVDSSNMEKSIYHTPNKIFNNEKFPFFSN